MSRNYIRLGFHLSQTALAVYLSVLAFEAWNDAPVVTSGVHCYSLPFKRTLLT